MLLNERIPLSYVLRKIQPEIYFVFLIGIVTHYIADVFRDDIPAMPIAIPAFLGTAISVILSFKLNQSYDRWWEARKIWGSIVNDSRSLVVQLQSFLPLSCEQDVRRIAFRQIGWCFSLGQSLRSLDAVSNLEKYVDTEELKRITSHTNKPLAILQLNSAHIADLRRNGNLDVFSQVHLNNIQINLTNSMGMAERIKNTVFPQTYRLFLHLFIYLFVIALSVSLSGIESYFEIPLLLVISSVFFLLEKTATHLQDPFSNRPTDTAMTAIATGIEINLKQLIGDKNISPSPQPSTFYLL